MTITIYAIHAPDAEKLKAIIAEMQVLGAPTIEVIDCGDYYQSLEGSHRLAAANVLGLTPTLIVHDQDEMLNVTKYDWYEGSNWATEFVYPAGEVAAELFSATQSVSYSF